MKISLVCSTGGHLYELFLLKKFWRQYPRFWVTFDRGDAHYLLEDEKVYFAYSPTNRNVVNLLRNALIAWRIIVQEKPNVIITTGAGVGVPFVYVAKLFKVKTIFIESLTRPENLSLSGKMTYWVVDRFYVQWPSLARHYGRAQYRGRVI